MLAEQFLLSLSLSLRELPYSLVMSNWNSDTSELHARKQIIFLLSSSGSMRLSFPINVRFSFSDSVACLSRSLASSSTTSAGTSFVSEKSIIRFSCSLSYNGAANKSALATCALTSGSDLYSLMTLKWLWMITLGLFDCWSQFASIFALPFIACKNLCSLACCDVVSETSCFDID